MTKVNEFKATLYFSSAPELTAEKLIEKWALEGYTCDPEESEAIFQGLRGETHVLLEQVVPADLSVFPPAYPAAAQTDIEWDSTYCVNPKTAFADFQQSVFQANLIFRMVADDDEPRIAHNEWVATLLGIHQAAALQALWLRDLDILVGHEDLSDYLRYADTHRDQPARFAPMLAFGAIVVQRKETTVAWTTGLGHFGHLNLYVEEKGLSPFTALTLVFNTAYMISGGYRYPAGDAMETEGFHCRISEYFFKDKQVLRLNWIRPETVFRNFASVIPLTRDHAPAKRQTCRLISAQVLADQYQLTHLPSYSRMLKKDPDMVIAVYEGHTVFDQLNLDLNRHDPGLPENCRGILITGDLTVKGCIYNEKTTAAIGLVVLGNVSAANIVIGGQDVYVRGDVDVEGIYCGSHHHGESHIDGCVSAVLLISDNYRFWIKGALMALLGDSGNNRIGLLDGKNIEHGFHDTQQGQGARGYGGARWIDAYVPLDMVLDRSCINNHEPDTPLLFRRLVRHIANGVPVLKTEVIEKPLNIDDLRRGTGLFHQGCDAYEAGDYEKASVFLQDAIDAGYRSSAAHYWLAQSLYEIEKAEQALPHLSHCIEQGFQVMDCLILRASAWLMLPEAMQDHESAWLDCKRVIAESSEHEQGYLADAYSLLGYSLYLQSRYEEAIPWLKQALAIDASAYCSNLNMARCLWQLGRYEEVLPFVDASIRTRPHNNAAHYIRGHALFMQSDCAAAIPSLAQVVGDEPENINACNYLIRCYVIENRLAEAWRLAQHVFEIDPEEKTANPEGLIAYAYWMADREAEGVSYASRSILKNPEPGYHFLIAGWCYYSHGEPRKAIELWRRFAGAEPGCLHVWTALAGTFLEMKLYKDAAECAAHALNIDPANAVALSVNEQVQHGKPVPIFEKLRRFFRRES